MEAENVGEAPLCSSNIFYGNFYNKLKYCKLGENVDTLFVSIDAEIYVIAMKNKDASLHRKMVAK